MFLQNPLIRSLRLAAFAGLLSTSLAYSASYYWDSNGGGGSTGGSGTWDTTQSLWRQGSSGGTLMTWPNGNPNADIAYFDGTTGTVTINGGTTIYANGLSFGAQNWEIRSGNSSSKLVLNGTNPSLAIASSASTQNYTFNTAVELSSGTTTLTKAGTNIAALRIGVAPTTTGSGTSSWTIANGGVFNLASSSNRVRLAVGRQLDLNTQAVSAQFDLTGGQMAAYLNALQIGWRTNDLAGSASGNVSATVDFGTHASSVLNVDSGTSNLGAIGYLELNNATAAYTGSVAGTLNLGGGTNVITSSATGGVATLYVGQATNRGTGATNGSNAASASGTLNISGGTTTVTATGSGNANAIVLASRDATLGVNTTVSGTLNVTGGTLNVSGDDIYSGGGTSTVTLNGGTLNLGGGNLGRSGALITNLNFQSGTLANVNQINNGTSLTKTTGGTLTLSGTNAYTGDTLVSAGTLVVNGTLANTASVQVSSGATLGGSGSIGAAISGAGTVAPGNSPGILTATAVDAALGLDFTFEITALNPNYGNASSSLNDVLRLTAATPFLNPLTSGNVITINFSGVTLADGQIYSGGFYADQVDFGSSISAATFVFQGTAGYDIIVSTALQTANFGAGNVNGWVTQFEVAAIPEPSANALLLASSLMGYLFFHRRNSRRLS